MCASNAEKTGIEKVNHFYGEHARTADKTLNSEKRMLEEFTFETGADGTLFDGLYIINTNEKPAMRNSMGTYPASILTLWMNM